MSKRASYVVACLSIWMAALSSTAVLPAQATRLPSDLSEDIHDSFPKSKIRLDGAIETDTGDLFLPLIPNSASKKMRGKAHVDAYFPDPQNPEAIFYSNGWSYLRVMTIGNKKSVVRAIELPEKFQKQILGTKFPLDLIVPENFVMPESLKTVIGDMSIATAKDDNLLVPTGKTAQNNPAQPQHGMLFLTSTNSGSITMIDDRTLSKVAEFPTEGTPSSMVLVDGRVYITDEAKNRILLLDPAHRQFLGQINLPPHSAPKGIAATPNGQLIYVSESGAGDVAIIETATRKVLMRTRVSAGPGRIAMAPDGTFIVVLNATAGQATVISTSNQKVVNTIPVGSLPTAVVISPDSKTVYVSNRMSNTVSVITLGARPLIGTIATGVGPTGLAISEDGSKLYVANAREDTIAAFDTRTRNKIQDAKLPTEIDFPGALKILPDGKQMLISSEATENISLMDLATFEFKKQTPIGHFSHDIIWVPAE